MCPMWAYLVIFSDTIKNKRGTSADMGMRRPSPVLRADLPRDLRAPAHPAVPHPLPAARRRARRQARRARARAPPRAARARQKRYERAPPALPTRQAAELAGLGRALRYCHSVGGGSGR